MKTYTYIDGFNLYYGALKNTRYKWLDIVKLIRLTFPDNEILKVKYFTAMLNPDGDDERPFRQKMFLDALKVLYGDMVEIIFGHFRTDAIRRPVALYQEKRYGNVASDGRIWVIKHEEKGSDVNLAVHAVYDACQNYYDAALFISNDSDLAGAMKLKNQKER